MSPQIAILNPWTLSFYQLLLMHQEELELGVLVYHLLHLNCTIYFEKDYAPESWCLMTMISGCIHLGHAVSIRVSPFLIAELVISLTSRQPRIFPANSKELWVLVDGSKIDLFESFLSIYQVFYFYSYSMI